jgi:putative hydrolase of the HAD superfamily
VTEKLTTVAFDADDTLWHNERVFRLTQERFVGLLADYIEGDHLAERLLAAEERNLGHYGFGVKGFVLSMIETAIEVTEERVPARVIHEIMESGRAMLDHPIELLPHAEATIAALAPDFRILLITKGDLLDQERKLAQSGLGERFDGVEIVSDKTPEIYRTVFDRHGTVAEAAMMIGNSLRSDVNPVLEIGAWGVHVPHEMTWGYEVAEAPDNHPRFHRLETLEPVRALIEHILRGAPLGSE